MPRASVTEPMSKPKKVKRPATLAYRTYSDNLRMLMHDRDISHTEVARRIKTAGGDVSYKTVKRVMELHPSEPGLDTLEDIARVFGLEVWQMLIQGLRSDAPPHVKQELLIEA